MVQISKDTYEDLTRETFEVVLDGFARGAPPAPGPQNGRHTSMPITGLTSLTEIDFAADDVASSRPANLASSGQLRASVAGPSAPPGRAPAEGIPGGEVRDAETARRKGRDPDKTSGADPAGPATEAQEAGRVDPTGRSDDAAARSQGDASGGPEGHAAKVETGEARSGGDKAAQPRTDRDSPNADRDR